MPHKAQLPVLPLWCPSRTSTPSDCGVVADGDRNLIPDRAHVRRSEFPALLPPAPAVYSREKSKKLAHGTRASAHLSQWSTKVTHKATHADSLRNLSYQKGCFERHRFKWVFRARGQHG